MLINTINIPIVVLFTIYMWNVCSVLLHSLFFNMCDIFRELWLSSRGWPPLSKLTWWRWDDHMIFLIQWWWLWASTLCMRHMRRMNTYSWEGRVTYPHVEFMCIRLLWRHVALLCYVELPIYLYVMFILVVTHDWPLHGNVELYNP